MNEENFNRDGLAEDVIQTHQLTVYYGRHRGIIDVDLSIQSGEIFGFLGPNGAGKTTAMRDFYSNNLEQSMRSLDSHESGTSVTWIGS